MQSVYVQNLNVGKASDFPIFLDEKFILLPAGCTFTEEIKKALEDWEIKNILCDAPQKQDSQEDFESDFKNTVQTDTPAPKKMDASEFESVSMEDFGFSIEEEPKKEQQKQEPKKTAEKPQQAQTTQPSQVQAPQKMNVQQNMQSNIQHPRQTNYINLQAGQISQAENYKLEEAQTVYNNYLVYITKIYTRYATHKELNIGQIEQTMQELCFFIQNNKKFILRVTPEIAVTGKDFLVSHALRSAIFSIVIGLQFNMPFDKLVELAATAILHEIGQIRLPPQLYLTQKSLSVNERAQLATHTVLGFNILKENKFPLSMQLGVLEHHERENGTGYPRHLTGEKISLYAKIISVACSFEAITAPRDYKTAKHPFEAMCEMLRNENHQYDETVIKALLFSVSLYPIGAYVLLSNNHIAQVTDTNSVDPRFPIVQIVGMKNELGNPLTVQVDGHQLKIVKVLEKSEVNL